MAPTRVTLESEDGQRIVETYKSTKSVNETHERTGRSRELVRRIVREAGFDTNAPAQAKAPFLVGDFPTTEEVSREEILQHEVTQLRAAMKAQRKGKVEAERIVQAVEEALATVEFTPTLTPPPLQEPSAAAHHRGLLLLSDWHGGEQVDPETVNGLNDYDWEIMDRRLDELLHGVLSHLRRSPEVTGLDVAFLGDMSSGSNHEELAKTNQFPLAEQGVRIGYKMGEVVSYLADHVPEVRVASVVGNHPRLVKRPAAKDTHDNMDWVSGIIGREATAKRENVTSFIVGRTSLVHTIAGRNMYLWHGDGIRSTMPGVPWGGVMRRVNEIERTQLVKIHHYALGHFHSPNIVQGGRIMMNGSLKGVDEWVIKNFGGGEPPHQLLVMFDEAKQRQTDVKFLTPTYGLPGLG